MKDTVPLVAPDSVITCVSDAPEILAETVSVALELTAEVLTENVVDVEPPGMVTVGGIVQGPVPDKATVDPAGPGSPESVTVAVSDWPPSTLP